MRIALYMLGGLMLLMAIANAWRQDYDHAAYLAALTLINWHVADRIGGAR